LNRGILRLGSSVHMWRGLPVWLPKAPEVAGLAPFLQ